MAVQIAEVRELVDFAPEGFLVTSFFLDVDATDFPSDDMLATSFNSLMHDAESRRKDIESELSHDATESVRGDLAKIRDFLDAGIDRTDTRGIAIFSCSAQDFWQVVQMPTPVENRVWFEARPHVSQIARFLSHTKPTAILLTDSQHARIFTMKGGDVIDWTDFESPVPQRSMAGGWSQQRYQRRHDHWSAHHVDKAAELVLKLLNHYPFDWLIIGAEVQSLPTLKSSLHPYVADRVIGEVSVRIDADAAEILEKAEQVREEAESRYIDTLIEQIQEFAGAGGRGTIGLEESIKAINEQKVHILVVQEGLSEPGAVCNNCGLLMVGEHETCTACRESAKPADNIVDAAIQRSLELGSNVEVATEVDRLAPIQGIGAVLYY